jgi:thiol:disulfide interchange protein DsbD
MILRSFFVLAGLLVGLARAEAAHTEAQLLLSAENARPGEMVWAAVDLKMEPGWHTYWKNPGAAGQATEIKWQLPAGVSAGDIQWPVPVKLPPADITTYGYEQEVVLLVPLKLAADLPAGPLNISAKVSWLECNESCIPASAQVQTSLNLGSETKNSAAAALIESWRKRTPQNASAVFQSKAWWQKPAEGDQRSLSIGLDWLSPKISAAPESVDFFPDASDDYEIQAATQAIASSPGGLQLGKLVKKFSGGWPATVSGLIVIKDANSTNGYEIKLPIADQPPSATAGSTNLGTTPPPPAFWQMLVYAFIGGLILNIMPCVLPVIALKILGFVSEAKSEPRHVRKLGLIYMLGVLVSFLVLAAFVIAVKSAGHKAGWGMQFGNPIFLVCLATLVTLVALNLFGVFEVILGGGAIGAAGELASKTGAAGAFFNGVLATALATPCTAPFLSIALGFAFAQGTFVIVTVFLSVGLGLAAPYVLLSWNPAWLKFLPRPGAWMEKFKVAMGFPMLATVVWLFNLAAGSYGSRALWLGVFLVMIAFAAWIFGEFIQRGRKHKMFAGIIVAFLLVSAYACVLENQLHWRVPLAIAQTQSVRDANGIPWQSWSTQALAEARATGQPVLVDFTADWCLTCQVNKRTSLEVPTVAGKIHSLHAVALQGDYTHFPDAITSELNYFNRAGVPLVLVYPKDGRSPPMVLPEVLTPGIVLAALEKAAQ